MRAEVAAGQKAVSVTMAAGGRQPEIRLARADHRRGLGQRLANTIRSQTYPKGRNSLDAAALVWSNAPVIIGAHDTGPLIRSGSGFWLAIPLPAAGKALGGKRITPGMWEQKTGLRLRFVYRSRGPSLLVADAVRLNTRGQAAVSKSKTGKGQVTARSSCWCGRSNCPSGWIWRAMPNERRRPFRAASCAIGSRITSDRHVAPSISGFALMPHGQDHRRFAVKPVEGHISAVTEGDEPLAKLRIHVLDGTPDTWLVGKDAHALANGFGRTTGCVRVLFGKEMVEAFNIPQRCGGPDQPWHSGTVASSPVSSFANHASASACVTC